MYVNETDTQVFVLKISDAFIIPSFHNTRKSKFGTRQCMCCCINFQQSIFLYHSIYTVNTSKQFTQRRCPKSYYPWSRQSNEVVSIKFFTTKREHFLQSGEIIKGASYLFYGFNSFPYKSEIYGSSQLIDWIFLIYVCTINLAVRENIA